MTGADAVRKRATTAEHEFPYLERLQPKMDERLERRVPPSGRFCGFCYGRLQADDRCCPYCGADLAQVGTAREIPQEVLRIYAVKRRVEARWVHGGAMLGLAIASVLFLVLVVWGPGLLGHPGVAFTVLIGGGYVLAQLFGTVAGGHLGYQRAVRRRRELWEEYLARRSHGDGGAGPA